MKNLYVKSDPPKGEAVLKDGQTILAYLEDLARRRAPVKLWCKEQDRVALAAQVAGVDEATGKVLLRLQRALPGDLTPKQRITMVFLLEGARMLAVVRFLERGGYLEAVFTIPDVVRHAEQRGKLRARFGAKDKATVTVLEDLRDRLGATGRLVDLSMTGLCMRLERAVEIRGNDPLQLATSLFPAGTRFPIIRIDQLPFAPVVTCSGRVAHIRGEEEGGGILMGIALDPPDDLEAMVLDQVLSRRLPSFNQGFPVLERVPQEALARAWTDPEDRPGGAEGAEGADPAGEAETGEGEPEEAVPAQASVPEPEPDPALKALLKRKRQKRILLIMLDDLDRAILSCTLKVDGYEKIHEAHSFLEALAHFKVFDLDAVIIEQQVGEQSAQEFLVKLRKQGFCVDPPVVLLTPALDVRIRIMAKAAGIEHIQQVPVDYDGIFRDVLHGLLKLA